MPNESDTDIVVKPDDGRNKIKEESSQSMQVLLEKVMGNDSFTPTAKQFDEILSQRKTVYSYIHEERMQDHEKFKIESDNSKYFLNRILIFIGLLGVIVLIYKPEYFTQVLSALLGFAGGFGLGRFKSSSKPD